VVMLLCKSCTILKLQMFVTNFIERPSFFVLEFWKLDRQKRWVIVLDYIINLCSRKCIF
jgi:hypothetical protein